MVIDRCMGIDRCMVIDRWRGTIMFTTDGLGHDDDGDGDNDNDMSFDS